MEIQDLFFEHFNQIIIVLLGFACIKAIASSYVNNLFNLNIALSLLDCAKMVFHAAQI